MNRINQAGFLFISLALFLIVSSCTPQTGSTTAPESVTVQEVLTETAVPVTAPVTVTVIPTASMTAESTAEPTATATHTPMPTPTVAFQPISNGPVSLVSLSAAGEQANGPSGDADLSADGQWVVFGSAATNLVRNDTNNRNDLFLHNRQTGQLTRISVASDGTQADDTSLSPSISADGRYIAYASFASNLVDAPQNWRSNVYLYDRDTQETTLISALLPGEEPRTSQSDCPSISANGRFIAFRSSAKNIIDAPLGDHRQILLYDRVTQTLELISRSASGEPGNEDAGCPVISGDGQVIAFPSKASNLADNTSFIQTDLYLYQRATEQITLLTRTTDGWPAGGEHGSLSLSDDGQRVAFVSSSRDLVADDENGRRDVFLLDLATGQLQRLTNGEEHALGPSLSGNGRYVAYWSRGRSVLRDPPGWWELYRIDLTTGQTLTLDLPLNDANAWVDEDNLAPILSQQGNVLLFTSLRSDLVTENVEAKSDIFTYELGN